MTDEPLGFSHRWVPPRADGLPITLLLLHGTGGSEHDLLPLGEALAPGAAMLSPRGKVLERGMPRFFRRLAEGVLDEADLRVRAAELAEFVDGAADAYGFDPGSVVAAGFSNGANIAAGMLLLHPGVLAGAILFRAMVPLQPDVPPDLTGTGVLLSAGRRDAMMPPGHPERLAGMLRDAGADVTLAWRDAGHELTGDDVDEAATWLARSFGADRTKQ
jgi:phospholipase/carboxylesterase/glyoxalase family protein